MKILEFDGWRICHCGDIGETLDDPEKVAALQNLDILIIPVGGFYTVNAALAFEVTQKVKPRWVIPCHYKTLSCGFDIADRTPFVDCFEKPKTCSGWQATLDLETIRSQPNAIQCMSMDMKYDRATEQVVGHYRPKTRT